MAIICVTSNAISSNKSLVLIKTIAGLLVGKLKISRKYYSSGYHFSEAGLVRRYLTKYILTMVGKLVYEVKRSIAKAADNYLKLGVYRVEWLEKSIEVAPDHFNKFIDAILDNFAIRKKFPNESNPQKNPDEGTRT
jgi:hypothetical protein